MSHSEFTLSSPISDAIRDDRPLLCLTIAWHPDAQRIGEQFLAADGGALEIARYLPLFRAPASGQPPTALGYGGISRAPLRVEPDDSGGVTLSPPESRMVVEVNGVEVQRPLSLSAQQVDAGVIIGLGRTVLLCLHRMGCLPQANEVPGFIGVGSAAIRARNLIRQAAQTGATVLLLGETGTGKEVAARAIHTLGQRSERAMVSVNMAALNESLAAADLFGAAKGAYTGAQLARAGYFAEAEGGTLFLDEIGNTPAPVQPMLLRVLETSTYRPLGGSRDLTADVRLITATDQDLYGGGFNLALLRRLESFVIQLPSLRTRREDLGLLIAHQLAASGAPSPLLPTALVTQLLCYHWPGNVRQLMHVVKRCVLSLRMGETPQLKDLVDVSAPAASSAAPQESSAAAKARTRLADISEHEVLQAMEQNDWYIQGAAQALGVSRPSMYKLLETHPQIRRAEQIAADELQAALSACGGDIENCAARLQTPAEALRRYLRSAGLLA